MGMQGIPSPQCHACTNLSCAPGGVFLTALELRLDQELMPAVLDDVAMTQDKEKAGLWIMELFMSLTSVL